MKEAIIKRIKIELDNCEDGFELHCKDGRKVTVDRLIKGKGWQVLEWVVTGEHYDSDYRCNVINRKIDRSAEFALGEENKVCEFIANLF